MLPSGGVGLCWYWAAKTRLPISRFSLQAVAVRLQQLSDRTVVDFVRAGHIVGRLGGDRRQYQTGPALLDQDAGKVIDMQPLHRDAHQAGCRIIEPRSRSAV